MVKETQGNEKRLLRTSEAAEAAGVSKQTLQYYLLVGLISPTERTGGGQQLFDDAAVYRIRLVKEINESGYPLREIREIFFRGRGEKSAGRGASEARGREERDQSIPPRAE